MPAGVPTDPWSAGFMAVASIANSPPPSSNAAQQSNNVFDNSGFVVNIGAGSAASTKTALPSAAQALNGAAAGVGSLLSNPVVVIAVGLALFLYLKHK